MDLPDFLRFDPVPLRAQHNGWTPSLQLRFILELARGAGPDEAARAIGKARQSAYRLRKQKGAESFAAAWDCAQSFARHVASLPSMPTGSVGIDTLLVPRFYRGRLIGFVQREDRAGLMRILGRLDRSAKGGASAPSAAMDAFERFMRPSCDRSDGNVV